jgi:hypothetical protein
MYTVVQQILKQRTVVHHGLAEIFCRSVATRVAKRNLVSDAIIFDHTGMID